MLTTLSALLEASHGLLVMSETDAPLELFVWPAAVPWTAEATVALLALPADTKVETISLEQFFTPQIGQYEGQPPEEQVRSRGFQRLYDTLKTQLSDICVLRIGEIEIAVWIVGSTPEGCKLGFTTMLVET